MSKQEQAKAELEHALHSVGKALSLLGGRTRLRKPKVWSAKFVSRQYLESIESRLQVVQTLLMSEPRSIPDAQTEFEKEYEVEHIMARIDREIRAITD